NPRSAIQNIIRNPNRIVRSLPATVLVICPNVAPRNVPLGLLKCGVLVMLKMSTRNSPLTLATENSLAIVASRFTYAGPSSTPLRSELPNVFGAGDENTDGSNQSAPGPTAPSTAGVPLTSGRCVLPGALSVAALIVMAIGDPDCAEIILLIRQPPSTW